jgi:hypothetical protein
MPDKALNIVVNAQATLKIGFDDKLKQFDVVLKSENSSLDGRLDLVRKYFMLR